MFIPFVIKAFNERHQVTRNLCRGHTIPPYLDKLLCFHDAQPFESASFPPVVQQRMPTSKRHYYWAKSRGQIVGDVCKLSDRGHAQYLCSDWDSTEHPYPMSIIA